ncbi:hypothetical protein DHB64_18325 [Antarcticibacterium sp. W02-3]|nr:hypothetical protein [Antarcticibacterium sp. W02-3]
MTGDCHVRFCERLRGETPLCLLGGFLARFAWKRFHAKIAKVSAKFAKQKKDFKLNEQTRTFKISQ